MARLLRGDDYRDSFLRTEQALALIDPDLFEAFTWEGPMRRTHGVSQLSVLAGLLRYLEWMGHHRACVAQWTSESLDLLDSVQ